MSRPSVRVLPLAVVLVLALALPGAVLAATVQLGGTVVGPDGQPVANAEVSILAAGTDEIIGATTDANGAWSAQLDAAAGTVLDIRAQGPTVRSEPDAEGCVTVSTPTGSVSVTVTEDPQAPVVVTLDGAISSTVCAATATPETPATTARPHLTPPPTDARGRGLSSGSGPTLLGGALLVIAAVALFGAFGTRRAR